MEQKNLLKYLRVSVNTNCNKNCWYCFSEGIHEKKEDMTDINSFGWMLQILKTHFGTINVRFTGGEPLLNENLVHFVRLTKKIGINNIGITTNGTRLLKEFDSLYKAGAHSFAVHITDIDNNDWKLETFDKTILKRDGLRYNIVVTKNNCERVNKFLEYANKQKLDVLLLDLIKNKLMTEEQHSLEYINLDFFAEKLLLFNYNKYIQNQNCVIFYNENHNIKLVKRYTELGGYKYCTQKLDMHPVLLTSDFNFRLCNHFGIKEIMAKELVKQRNEEKFIKKVYEVLCELNQCGECSDRLVLNQ